LKHFDGLAFMGMRVSCKGDNDRRGKNAHDTDRFFWKGSD